jgi:hypothetical protein
MSSLNRINQMTFVTEKSCDFFCGTIAFLNIILTNIGFNWLITHATINSKGKYKQSFDLCIPNLRDWKLRQLDALTTLHPKEFYFTANRQ